MVESNNNFHYLSTDDIISLHQAIEAWDFSIATVINYGMLDMCAEKPMMSYQKEELYETLWLKAAVLFECIINVHPFEDGNKRTALLAAKAFLRMNGQWFTSEKCESVMICNLTIEHRIRLEELADWFAGRLCS